MDKGFDANFDLTKYAACLVGAGIKFVIRYYNINNPSKNLTLGEAKVLVAAGLKLGSVWENGFPDHAGYFSHLMGVHDATTAYQYASQTIGQPAGTPIYFAADYDATPADVAGVLTEYFQGVADGFQAITSKSPAAPKYAIGVYGSGLTCSSLLKAGLVSFCWLSQSTGFRGTKTFADYNIKQLAGESICQINGDGNETNDAKTSGLFTV